MCPTHISIHIGLSWHLCIPKKKQMCPTGRTFVSFVRRSLLYVSFWNMSKETYRSLLTCLHSKRDSKNRPTDYWNNRVPLVYTGLFWHICKSKRDVQKRPTDNRNKCVPSECLCNTRKWDYKGRLPCCRSFFAYLRLFCDICVAPFEYKKKTCNTALQLGLQSQIAVLRCCWLLGLPSMIVSTEIATPPKSRNSHTFFGISQYKFYTWDSSLIWICTEEFEFLDLVDFGVVAFPVETVIKVVCCR